MKKFCLFLLAIIFCMPAFLLGGCGDEKEGLTIYASFYPAYYLASAVAKDKAKVINLVPAGAEAHGLELTIKQTRALSKSDMIIYNGAGMETWLEPFVKSLDKNSYQYFYDDDGPEHDGHKGVLLLDLSHNLDLISFDDADHDHDHDHGSYDPHTWTSLKNMAIMLGSIKDAFIRLDSQNKDYYEQNYQTLLSQIQQLDKEYSLALDSKNLKTNTIVVSHESFAYLCRDYGLNQIALQGITTEDDVSISKVIEVANIVKTHNIKVLFWDNSATNRALLERVAELAGYEVSIEILSPVENLTAKEIQNGDTYLTVMRRNLDALKKALTES